jgi:hypothetical protein
MNKLWLILLSFTIINYSYANEENWWDSSTKAVVNLWSSVETTSTEEFAEIWENITPKLNEVLELEQQAENTPNSVWLGLGTDKEDLNQEINQLLDEAVEILSVSNTNNIRQAIRAEDETIREMKQDIAKYHQAQITAPVNSTWKTTIADYEVKIKQLTESIEQSKTHISKLKAQFAQQLSNKGLSISTEQLDVLLSSVVGDDIIKSSIVYDHIKQISQQLMILTEKSGEDINISQRYYGMYTVLLKILLHMQQNFINKIDNQYLPKIANIIIEVKNINVTTGNLLRSIHDKTHRKHLFANLQAQNLTLQTAELYKKHLVTQRYKIAKAIIKTSQDLQIAQNTYKTVRIGGELINLLRSSNKSFEILLNIQVPDLLIFENKQMKHEFAILTQKLSQ